jgi:hypothetical protein
LLLSVDVLDLVLYMLTLVGFKQKDDIDEIFGMW